MRLPMRLRIASAHHRDVTEHSMETLSVTARLLYLSTCAASTGGGRSWSVRIGRRYFFCNHLEARE